MNRHRKKQSLPRLGAAFAVLILALGSLTIGALTAQGRITKPLPEDRMPREQTAPAETLPTAEQEEDWLLRLVNPWNILPEDFSVDLTQLINGQAIDERCYPDLQQMMDDCRAAGLSPLICSSYRSQEFQETLFAGKIERLRSEGYDAVQAQNEAAKVVALPGTSEHQLGLAVDIVAMENQNLDNSQEDTEVQKWLISHSWEYGFILRYPEGKSEITGIIYEPWHYRYVGREAAAEIYAQGLCLEEYLESRSKSTVS